VVGVASGAGDYRPAIVLDRKPTKNRAPLARVGKALCADRSGRSADQLVHPRLRKEGERCSALVRCRHRQGLAALGRGDLG
jgi:hypothetical protein